MNMVDRDFSLISVRTKIERALPFQSDIIDGDFALNDHMKETIVGNATKRAAVLIGLVEREGETHVILTKRTEKLTSHSGQISFPGGKIDEEDLSEQHAALREAWEEIGLDQNEVDVIGNMPIYHAGSRFQISPVLASVSSTADFEINRDEVDYMFEVPMRFLMDPTNHIITSKDVGDNTWHFYEMPYKEHYIWGMTAGMLRRVYERIFAHEAG